MCDTRIGRRIKELDKKIEGYENSMKRVEKEQDMFVDEELSRLGYEKDELEKERKKLQDMLDNLKNSV